MGIKIGNLGGTLYYEDTPLLEFKFINGSLVNCVLLVEEGTPMLPFEIHSLGVNETAIKRFWEERITPHTRQGIDEYLSTTPVKYYHPERMLRYCSGKCIHDKYWLDCDDDNSCWE